MDNDVKKGAMNNLESTLLVTMLPGKAKQVIIGKFCINARGSKY